jgi:DNA-binding transcriptional LysR family regulator
MNITLRQLEAFVAVADTRNFTRAAQRLHTAQSAISLLVKELEADLGVRLLDRTTRHVELTNPGIEFRGYAEKLIADLDHAIRHTHELVERKRGRIAVAAPPYLATILLPQVIAQFQQELPGIQIALIDARTDQIVARGVAGEADIGVGTFRGDVDGIARTVLARDDLMAFYHAKHPLARIRRPSWANLGDYPSIMLTRESGIRALVEEGYTATQVPIKPTYEVAQITTALALVEAGLGVSALPSYALASCHNRRVAARVLTAPAISRNVEVISCLGRTPPPAASEFVRRLQEHARRLAPRRT